jgi:hypothetical protein
MIVKIPTYELVVLVIDSISIHGDFHSGDTEKLEEMLSDIWIFTHVVISPECNRNHISWIDKFWNYESTNEAIKHLVDKGKEYYYEMEIEPR